MREKNNSQKLGQLLNETKSKNNVLNDKFRANTHITHGEEIFSFNLNVMFKDI